MKNETVARANAFIEDTHAKMRSVRVASFVAEHAPEGDGDANGDHTQEDPRRGLGRARAHQHETCQAGEDDARADACVNCALRCFARRVSKPREDPGDTTTNTNALAKPGMARRTSHAAK